MKFSAVLLFVLTCLTFVLIPGKIFASGYTCSAISGSCYSSLDVCENTCPGVNDPNPSSCYSTNCTPSTNNQPGTGSQNQPGTGAQNQPGAGAQNQPSSSTSNPTSGTNVTITLPNPLGNTNDIPSIIQKIIQFLAAIAAPIVAGMIIYGAYQILFAGGDPEKFATGRRTILYAAIGYAIILIGLGVASLIKSILSG